VVARAWCCTRCSPASCRSAATATPPSCRDSQRELAPTRRPDATGARSAIQQLLQKDPAKRPASAGEVVTLLQKTSVQAPAEVPARSIAVLYFENMSSEREGDYFCAGITEDIITDLSKVSGLRVVSRTDMLPFRNKEINIRQVAEALRVNYVLEGSVRKPGIDPTTAQLSCPRRLPSLGRPIRRPD
jgi:hypothetical protein